MTRGRGEASLPAGGPARHIPVLLAEKHRSTRAAGGRSLSRRHLGAGGYSRALLALGGQVMGVDRDPRAIAEGRAIAAAASGRLQLVEGRFGDLDEIARQLCWERLDGVVLDIGVSSMQLDEAERGFSLRFDAFLDMRMEGEGRTAADILAEDDEQTLADIFYHFGEERAARRIARAIVADRPSAPYVSTLQLARMIARVAPARPGELTHPATKVFQALRIAVNDELGQLLRGLGGRRTRVGPRRPARRRHVSFARGSYCQAVPRAPFRTRSGSLAAVAGRAADRAAELPGQGRTADPAERGGTGRQPARALGEAALGRAHGRAAGRHRRGQRRLDAAAAEFREEKLMMWRILHILAIGAVIASAAYVYSVKYQAIYASEQVVKTRHAIAKERDALNVLRAEYAHLIRPDRLQALADKLLDTQPLALNQIVKAGDLPLPAAKVDSIGRKLEALGLGQSSTPSAGVTGATPALR